MTANGPLYIRPIETERQPCVLSLDGGGMRGLIAGHIAEQVETAIVAKLKGRLLGEYSKYEVCSGDVTWHRLQSYKDFEGRVSDKELCVHLADWFPIICGTSTGSILASYFATKGKLEDTDKAAEHGIHKDLRPGSAARAQEVFMRRGKDIFTGAGGWLKFPAWLKTVVNWVKLKHSPAGIEEVLQETFGKDTTFADLTKKSGHLYCSLGVTSFDKTHGRAVVFWAVPGKSKRDGKGNQDGKGKSSGKRKRDNESSQDGDYGYATPYRDLAYQIKPTPAAPVGGSGSSALKSARTSARTSAMKSVSTSAHKTAIKNVSTSARASAMKSVSTSAHKTAIKSVSTSARTSAMKSVSTSAVVGTSTASFKLDTSTPVEADAPVSRAQVQDAPPEKAYARAFKADFHLWEVVRCSTAAPTFFPAYSLKWKVEDDKSGSYTVTGLKTKKDRLGNEVNGEVFEADFVDGGMVANDPTQEAIIMALRLAEKTGLKYKTKLPPVLSIGCGSALGPVTPGNSAGEWGWAASIAAIMFGASQENSTARFLEIMSTVSPKETENILRVQPYVFGEDCIPEADMIKANGSKLGRAEPTWHDAIARMDDPSPEQLKLLMDVANSTVNKFSKAVEDWVGTYLFPRASTAEAGPSNAK